MPLNPPHRLQLLDIALEVLEAGTGRAADAGSGYELRIALSLLRLVRRELELGDRLLVEEGRRLAALLGEAGDAETLNTLLCERIRQRRLATTDAGLLRHLRLTTLAKLAIDNPRYSACLRAGGGGVTGGGQ
ncbi:MAG: protein kinase [Gammaproteobacteria bacterium]|nr:protein kinase [Gammaproteobacteria bacterium]